MSVRTRLFLNNPTDAVSEMLEGYAAAHSDIIRFSDGMVVRTTPKPEGHVGVVIGNGSGHEPAMIGWVGEGLFDVNVPGPIFSSPGPGGILDGIRAADRGGGRAASRLQPRRRHHERHLGHRRSRGRGH